MKPEEKERERVFSELENLCLTVLGLKGKDGKLVPAEKAWMEREETYRKLVDLSPQAIMVFTEDQEIVFANNEAAELLAEPDPESVMGRKIVDFLHPDFRKTFVDRMVRLQSAKKTQASFDQKLICGDGNPVDIEVAAAPLMFKGQRAVQIVIRDITERKKIEDSFRQSDKSLRMILDSMTSAMLVLGRDGEIVLINSSARTCLELGDDVVGLRLLELVPDAKGLLNDASPEERKQLVINLPDGSAKILGYTSMPGREENSRTIVFRDVTHILENEDRKRRLEDLALVEDMVAVLNPKEITERHEPDDYPSEAMRQTLVKAVQAAATDSIILLLGESGSGKDFHARFIHNRSGRANGPYFDINCAAVPPELAESELFGHESGAFTGAGRRKRGLLELAENGSLLLNEIGELTLPLQAKLLTFLDSRSFTRVGGEKHITVNARLIVATNRDLQKDVEEGRFRQDLFYRLNVLTIRVPSLRERKEDIPIIVREIIGQLTKEMNLQAMPKVMPDTMEALTNYDWPGNVRELRNVLERALIVAKDGRIGLEELGIKGIEEEWSFSLSGFPTDRDLNTVTKELKRSLVAEALRRSEGSRKGAAAMLRISRNSLLHYMKTLGVQG
jgi:PAS domain S-box-containing protein